MKLAAVAALAVALAACGKKPPTAPTPEAVGAELATFPQILVLISSTTWADMQSAVGRNDMSHSEATAYPRPYAHGIVTLDGRETPVLVAYTGAVETAGAGGSTNNAAVMTVSLQRMLSALPVASSIETRAGAGIEAGVLHS